MRDTGIADRLRAAGLKVVEVDGWRTRGSETFNPRGSVDHHTAGGRSGNAPSLGICINGRADLPGPLCNVMIGRDDTCYVVAAGRANHAGTGGWRGLSGNSSVYGVERENVGTAAEPWRADQTESAAKCHAALIRGRAIADAVCEHKEWAPQRKVDAHTVTGAEMRRRVTAYLAGTPQEDDMTPDQEKLLRDTAQRLVNMDTVLQAKYVQIDTIEETVKKLEVGGVDVNLIASKVADLLAERLKS